MSVGIGSYGLACLASLGLVLLLAVRRITPHWSLVGLAVTTLAWAAIGLGASLGIDGAAPLYRPADFLRSAALLLLVDHALRRLSCSHQTPSRRRFGSFVAPSAGILALALGALVWIGLPDAHFWALIGHVGLAVAGLFLIENLLQASRPDALWSTKHLLIGAGAIFAFDLFYYTDALLLMRVDDTLRVAQPAIATLAFPLMLISARRLRDVKIDLPVSRSLVVGTTALLASGVYILSIAAIAYLIRGLGWSWGPTLQLVFLFGAAMVLLVLLSSTSIRHGGRRFIERNIFTFAYDYRREWLRLVESMAGGPIDGEQDNLSLDQRALKATAALMDADGGALFMRSGQGGLKFKASWNIAIEDRAPGSPPEALMEALSTARPALVLDDPGHLPADLRAEIEPWLATFKTPWILLALIARNEIVGLAIITRPRMKRRLTFEDFDLLAIFANQLGSYLTVEALARHVAETEHFERLSKHVTFVAHDLKNVISQLSLVLQQAKDHAHNPAFVSDTFLTIGDAVERMKRLMQKVQEGAGQAVPLQPVDLASLARKAEMAGRVDRFESVEDEVLVDAEPAVLEALLDHLIDNARDACEQADEAAEGDTAPSVALTLKKEDRQAVLELVDRGVGMSAGFIETELFKPFRSTKKAGFGIGMYQCRDWIERWRGRLDIESRPGHGTTVRIILPLAGGPRVAAPAGTRSQDTVDHEEDRAA